MDENVTSITIDGNITSTENWFIDAGNYVLGLGINEVIGLSAAALFLIAFLGSDKTIKEPKIFIVLIFLLGTSIHYIFATMSEPSPSILFLIIPIGFMFGLFLRILLKELNLKA